MDSSGIKLLIVEDEAIIAEDISAICSYFGYDVIDTAHSAGHALNIIDSQSLDLVLLDINLQDEVDGIDIAQYLVDTKNIPFIYITSYSDMDTLGRAKSTRPMGYIVKPFSKNQLLSTIEIALYNHSQKQIPGGLDLTSINDRLITPLTEREFAILIHIYNGKTNQQMARLEFISVNTIKYHLKQLYTKLDVNSRSTLLAKLRSLLIK